MSNVLAALQDRSFASATSATTASYPPGCRLSPDELAAYLDRRAFAVIGTRRRDGRPHAAIGTYARRDATFWLPTIVGSVRQRNLDAEPWLTMTVTEGDHGQRHVAVLMEGPARIVSPGDVPADVRATSTGPRDPVWIRFTPERVLSYISDGPAG